MRCASASSGSPRPRVTRDPALIEEFLIGHRAIAAAIEQQDRDLVAEWVAAHIEASRVLTSRQRF